MSLFRKQAPSTVAPIPEVDDRSAPIQQPPPPPAPTPGPQARPLFSGPAVDIPAVYTAAKVSPEERDRVTRAEALLGHLPNIASQTKNVVDATLKAFGVDARKIVDAATKEVVALEGFIRMSQEQTQRVNDEGAKRIAELQAEIERCRQIVAQATREGEERARTVNAELTKVQRVLEFFGHEVDVDDIVDSQPAEGNAIPATRSGG